MKLSDERLAEFRTYAQFDGTINQLLRHIDALTAERDAIGQSAVRYMMVERVAKAIEVELDRDFAVWLDRWTNPGGSFDDAPSPPSKRYTTDPIKLARAALEAICHTHWFGEGESK